MKNSKFKSAFIQGNPTKSQLPDVIYKLYEILTEKNIEIFFDEQLESILTKQFCEKLPEGSFGLPQKAVDVALSLGGDGTVLRSLQKILPHKIPILPLNLGGLGFLTEITIDEIDTKFVEILEGNYIFDERAILKATVVSSGEVFYGLNDAVVDKAGFPNVIFFHTLIDGKFFNNYIADGLMVSTPTGSTGYSFSANGPLIMPNLDALIINPICPHSLTNRPMVISSDQTVEVEVFTDEKYSQLIVDGEHRKNLNPGEWIKISKGEHTARLVRHSDSHFFKILRHKLHWGEDLRTKERWAKKIKNLP
ncbi:MAG: NAD(+)/NADH kinase [Calditrichia bacterium]|nr:NAD(+)/NADH kinase [Calditrichia bacterium]